jgi:hypothetical protein
MMGIRAWTRTMITCALLAATAALPSTAQADVLWPRDTCSRIDNARYACNVRVSTLYTYQGWAHTGLGRYCGGAMPSPGMEAAASRPRAAWRWTGSNWSATTLPAGAQVYVWPYAAGWSWVWTQSSGWLAIQDAELVINPYCSPYLL